MANIKIAGFSEDLRTMTHVIYAQVGISDYLSFVGDDFDQFGIQRKRETHPGYARLKKDIAEGTLLPPITLALKPTQVKTFSPLLRTKNKKKIEQLLSKHAEVYILDGLQRTHIMKDLKEEGVKFKSGQKLLLEFWFEEEMSNLVYRLIVLNAGQKPMSMRHQVELLFMTMQDKLKQEIPNLEIYNEREKKVRDKAMKLPFDRIVTGYHSFLNESPEIKKQKIVTERMDEGRIISEQELEILDRYPEFTQYLSKYVDLDNQAYRVYSKLKTVAAAKNWLADENVINSFFAAVGYFSEDTDLKARVDISLESLKGKLEESGVGEDPFALTKFDEIRKNLDPKKFNIGFATRRTIMDGFLEYFRNEGRIPFEKCWDRAQPVK